MKKLAIISGIISLTCLLFVAACQNDSETKSPTAVTVDTYLVHALPYTVVRETNWTTEDPIRNTVSWQITSEDAAGFDEYAQTVAKAVLDLYDLYERDFTSVTLLPAAGVYVPYAYADFAADGKGNAGLTGSAPSKECYWNIKSADRTLTETELAIAELWWNKRNDFPSKNPISSLSYDEVALRQYIAETLNIPYDEAIMPTLKVTEYELEQSFIDWTISMAAQQNPRLSSTPCFEANIKVETGNFAIYGVSRMMTEEQMSQTRLDDFDLTERPIITIDDIVSYNKETYEIELSQSGLVRFNSAAGVVIGQPFVVCVGTERIFYGVFWSAASSSLPPEISIYVFPPNGILISPTLNITSWGSTEEADPMADARILQSFGHAGKLN